MISKVLSQFRMGDQLVRIIVAPKKFIIYSTELNFDQKIYDGVAKIIVSTERGKPTIKTTDYKNCLNAYKLAPSRNCFNAILLDKKGQVCEGSRSE